MAELDTSASNQPPDPPPGQEIDPDKLDSTNSYRRGDAPDLTALARPPANLTGNLADLQKRKMGAEAAIDAQTTARMEQDRARMEKAFQEEGIGPDTIKPWNATEEHRKFETSPLESFGSVASVFAILASAFTHAPMENALNGSAAAMNAIRAGDENAYQRNFEAFKVNMDLAQKRFNMQHQLYSDALGLMQTDATLGRMKLENAARQFGDQKTLSLLEAGMDKELIDLINSRQKTAMQAFELSKNITDYTLRKSVFDASMKQLPDVPGQPPGTKDPRRVMQLWEESQGIKPGTPEQEEYHRFIANYPKTHNGQEPPPEEVAKFIQSMRAYGGAGTKSAFVNARVAELREQHPDMPFTEAMKQAEKEFTDANTRTRLITMPRLEAAEMEKRAQEYIADQKSPTYGDRAASFERARKEVGRVNAEATTAERVLANREITLELAANEARTLIPRVEEISDRIDRTQYPTLNSLIMAAKTHTGSEDAIRLGIAAQSLTYVYARVLKPVGVLNEADTARAEHILNTAWSNGQIHAALDQMRIEMNSAKQGLEQTKNPKAAPVKVTTPEEASKLKSGTHYLTPDGQEYVR